MNLQELKQKHELSLDIIDGLERVEDFVRTWTELNVDFKRVSGYDMDEYKHKMKVAKRTKQILLNKYNEINTK